MLTSMRLTDGDPRFSSIKLIFDLKVNHPRLIIFTLTMVLGSTFQTGWAIVEANYIQYIYQNLFNWDEDDKFKL